MLTRDSSIVAHWAQNAALILLSLICLPISNTALIATYAYQLLTRLRARDGSREAHLRRDDHLDSLYGSHDKRTILLTGLSMTKSLTILRLLSQHTSYKVIGADTSSLCPGRFSVHCHKFRLLASPTGKGGKEAYKASLLRVIEEENVGLWVSCSGVMGAVEDAEVREHLDKLGHCKSIQFGVEVTKMLHEKELFVQWLRENDFLIPETIEVQSREAALEYLYQSEKTQDDGPEQKRYILKPTGVIDAFRADMTLLPLSSYAETQTHIARLPITPECPWLLQEFIQGKEFCTHALIVRGKIRNFLACPSAELLMHYEALPTNGRLSKAMLKFTQQVADKLQNSEEKAGRDFTGHMSFDFLVKEADLENRSAELRLYPIECNPRVHTAVALFRKTPETVAGFVDALQGSNPTNGASKRQQDELVYPVIPPDTYWIGHDLVELLILPITRLLTLNEAPGLVFNKITDFLDHLTSWEDGAYDVEDPLPAWWLYQVYWPAMFANSILTGTKWSRINVSTTKMFGVE